MFEGKLPAQEKMDSITENFGGNFMKKNKSSNSNFFADKQNNAIANLYDCGILVGKRMHLDVVDFEGITGIPLMRIADIIKDEDGVKELLVRLDNNKLRYITVKNNVIISM